MRRDLLIIISVVVLTIGGHFIEYGNEKELTVKINKTERTIQGNASSFYLVFTDKGVFKIKDQLFNLKFNSSDIYGALKQDSVYVIKTTGYRVPAFSMYPNIVKAIAVDSKFK